MTLRSFLVSVSRGLWLIGGLSFVFNLLILALPIYSLQIFDRVLLSRSVDTLWVLTAGVILALGAASAIEGIRGQLLLRLSNRISLTFDRQLFDEILSRATRAGDRSLQAVKDLNAVRAFVVAPQGFVTIIDSPLIPLYLVVVYLMHPWLGHAMVIGALVLIGIAWANEIAIGAKTRQAMDSVLDAHQALSETIAGGDVVVAHGVAEQAFEHWLGKQHQALEATSRSGSVGGRFSSAAKSVRLLLNVTLTGLGAYLAINDRITLGAMIAANILTARALAPIEALIGAARQFIGVRMSWVRLGEILKAESRPEATRLPPSRGELEFERVVFVPPGGEQPTIKGVSLKLEPGSFVGLIGPSAAGKSTLMRLACHVWEPTSGTVRLDGADVRVWHQPDRGRACGYLPQDVQLLGGTVRDNICRFMEADDEEVVAAARAAGVHEMILRLPKGYETPIGSGGTRLSAGQRQRIGLARALFGEPRLILLDEPNSNLDTEGEQALDECLARTKARGATLVVISHRPAVLALADKLAVLVDGQIQQYGSRSEILQRVQPGAVAQVPHHAP
jgi:PrtD family type I secretion system ABC transporter